PPRARRDESGGFFMKLVLKLLLGAVVLMLLGAGGFAAYVAVDGIPRYHPAKVDLKVDITPERVARGKTISSLLCKECHFDAGTGRLSGRRMLDLPETFGAAFSRNITQDRERGIGAWTDGEIAYLL